MKIVLKGSPEELIMFRNNDQKYIKGAATNVAVEKLNLYVHHSKVKIFSFFPLLYWIGSSLNFIGTISKIIGFS